MFIHLILKPRSSSLPLPPQGENGKKRRGEQEGGTYEGIQEKEGLNRELQQAESESSGWQGGWVPSTDSPGGVRGAG